MKLRNLVVALALAPLASQACGPDFPADLLSNRGDTMLNLPEGAFYFEAHRLVQPAQKFNVVEAYDDQGNPQKVTRETIEKGWWGDRYAATAKLRDAGGGAEAFSAGADLPAEVRLYFAGAAAFAKEGAPAAAQRFHELLALPAAERTHYGLWAQYMLGRAAYAQKRYAEAAQAFADVRTLVTQGAEDPLGVAAASLGDEARTHLDAGEDAAAVALYAQQAAIGSPSGLDSLLFVARAIVRDDARMKRDLADPLMQRMLVAYLFTRSNELIDTRSEPGAQDGTPAAPTVPDKVTRFLAAVEKLGIDQVQGMDRLAALAYRSGRYDLATRLAAKDSSALSSWVRAKLALRAGDANAAAQAYAQAAKAFPADEEWGKSQMMIYDPTKPQCRVEGEQGTLALSRGEYVSAMEHLYNAASQYWQDAAYVAERVLTADELKTFVDTHAAKPAVAVPKPDDYSSYGKADSPSDALRALLARRLLRVERFDEAITYFDGNMKPKAQAYIDARHAVAHGDRVEQAQAWYAAAHAARFDGMELLGYELDPDYLIYSGDFDLNWHGDADGKTLIARDDIRVPAQFSGKDEPARAAANRADPLKRFHYRYNAVDFAQKSADLLPPRTQAFAAVLCNATSWLIDRDPDVAQGVYARYVKQGPYVSWAESFGRSCPAPDFAGAAKRVHDERVAYWRHLARKSLPYAIALAALAIVLAAVTVQRRRGRKRSAPAG
jgi:cellulose synthase operon protein C